MTTDSSEQEFQQAVRLIEQRRIYFRRPSTPARLIPKIIASSGIGNQQAASETAAAWQQVAGTQWSTCSLAGLVRRGHLEVTVTDSMVLQQLTFQQTELLNGMNRLLPAAKLKGIRFRVDPSLFRT